MPCLPEWSINAGFQAGQSGMQIPLETGSIFDAIQQLLIPQVVSMPTKALKDPIGSLAHLRDEMIAALDFAVTGI